MNLNPTEIFLAGDKDEMLCLYQEEVGTKIKTSGNEERIEQEIKKDEQRGN